CPNCRGRLRNEGQRLTCEGCARTYAISDGIVDMRFQRKDYYFNPVPREEMSALLAAATSTPWDDTIRRFLRSVKNVPEWIDNIAVDGRYSWKLLLELPRGCRFLDFGCGLGNLTHNIAGHVGEAVALDLTWERLQFAKQRFRELNPDDRILLIAAG